MPHGASSRISTTNNTEHDTWKLLQGFHTVAVDTRHQIKNYKLLDSNFFSDVIMTTKDKDFKLCKSRIEQLLATPTRKPPTNFLEDISSTESSMTE